jgi:phosphatidylglycerophosphate synthase
MVFKTLCEFKISIGLASILLVYKQNESLLFLFIAHLKYILITIYLYWYVYIKTHEVGPKMQNKFHGHLNIMEHI